MWQRRRPVPLATFERPHARVPAAGGIVGFMVTTVCRQRAAERQIEGTLVYLRLKTPQLAQLVQQCDNEHGLDAGQQSDGTHTHFLRSG
jgi:hypothetical protein